MLVRVQVPLPVQHEACSFWGVPFFVLAVLPEGEWCRGGCGAGTEPCDDR